MGSPITFSGFNSIDFNQILNAVMTQERTPLTRLETQKTTLEAQKTAFGTLATRLAALESAAEALKAKDSLATLKASSTDSGVGVATTSGTVTGTYDIEVFELAKAQVTSSTNPYTALTDVAATGGFLRLTPGNGDPAVDITLTGSTTLQQLADAINAETDSPASASVVQTSPGTYKLVLSGKETGADNSLTIDTTGLTGTALAFGASSQTAIDAELEVNGLPVTSASNTVSDVITGATLSLTKKAPGTIVTVKVDRDTDASQALIDKFIKAYNDLQTFAKDQGVAAQAGRPNIGRDPLLRGLRDGLRSASLSQYVGGANTRLAEIGVGFDMTGKMVLDSTVFKAAVAASPSAVQTLVSGAAGDGGAFGAFTALIEDYTETGGLVSGVRDRIDKQVSSIRNRLDTMEVALAIRRTSLQQEYIAADLAMTRLKAQSASLSSVGGGYKLF